MQIVMGKKEEELETKGRERQLGKGGSGRG